MPHWKTISIKTIEKVLSENKGKTEAEIRKALHYAYPFGERKMWPYKVWLKEIKIRMDKLFPPAPVNQDSNQIEMF